MEKYRKKPVVIEAVQYPCEHPALRRCDCASRGDCACSMCGHEFIETLEGRMRVSPGDWIIRGVQGEHYPCKPDIFAATYEPADAAPQPPAEAHAQGGGETDPMLTVAARNLRSYLSKASFSSAVDKRAAENCVEVLVAAATAPPSAPVEVEGPKAYCRECNAAGMSNCANFDECGGARCITCHQQLNQPAQQPPAEAQAPSHFIKVRDAVRGTVVVSKVFPGDVIAEEYDTEAQAQGGGEVVAWHMQHGDGLVALRKADSVDDGLLRQANADGIHTRPLVFRDDVARLVLKCRDALAEELAGWDIDPPLAHVKEAHDACDAFLSGDTAPPSAPVVVDGAAIRYALEHARDLDDGVLRVLAALAQQPTPETQAQGGEVVEPMTGDLLPCPFCGGRAVSYTHDSDDDGEHGVCCDNEDCPVGPYVCDKSSSASALVAWNTRAAHWLSLRGPHPAPSVPVGVEGLLECLPLEVRSANGYDAAWAAGFNEGVLQSRQNLRRALAQQPTPSSPVGVEDKARAMFEAQADELAAPWDRQWGPTKDFWRKRAAEALAQQPAAEDVPEGYALVPREPTEEMLEAAHYELADKPFMNNAERSERVYAAMLAAAPTSAPVGVEEVVDVDIPEPEGLEKVVRDAVAAWEECRSPMEAQAAMYKISNDLRTNEAGRALAQQPASITRCDDCHEPTGSRAVCEICADIRCDAVSKQPAAEPRSTHRAWRYIGENIHSLPCCCASTNDHAFGHEQAFGPEQPAAVDEAAIRYALDHARDLDDGVARVVAALAAQPGNLYVKDGDTEPHHDR